MSTEVITCPTCKRDWPRHGPCCTCQLCGKHHEDCRCLADDLNDALEEMTRERDRLREALREMVGRDVDTCIASECRDVPYLRRAEWCSSCIAREALGEEKP